MILGTATGLLTKYVLDKSYIFLDRTNSLRRHSLQFALYSMPGVFTTMIFWGIELMFAAVSENGRMRYVGAGISVAAKRRRLEEKARRSRLKQFRSKSQLWDE